MICVDASLAMKWILPEPYSSEARAMYQASLRAAEQMVAPPLLPIEVTNVLRQRMRRPEPLSLGDARSRLQQFLTYPITLSAPPGLYESALALADAQNLPAAYDAH